MTRTDTTRLSFPSKLSEVPAVQNQIVHAAEASGFAPDTVFAIRLALDEALTNAVRHGNNSDPDKQVDVEYRVGPEQIVITIQDQGPGFCPEELPDPTAEENICRPHGRGVMLMRAYMSDVAFNKSGNRVTLTKRRSCCLPQNAD